MKQKNHRAITVQVDINVKDFQSDLQRQKLRTITLQLDIGEHLLVSFNYRDKAREKSEIEWILQNNRKKGM